MAIKILQWFFPYTPFIQVFMAIEKKKRSSDIDLKWLSLCSLEVKMTIKGVYVYGE